MEYTNYIVYYTLVYSDIQMIFALNIVFLNVPNCLNRLLITYLILLLIPYASWYDSYLILLSITCASWYDNCRKPVNDNVDLINI